MHESYTDENYLHNADQQELESQRRRWIMGVNEFAFAIWFFILTPSKDVLCQLNVIDDIIYDGIMYYHTSRLFNNPTSSITSYFYTHNKLKLLIILFV